MGNPKGNEIKNSNGFGFGKHLELDFDKTYFPVCLFWGVVSSKIALFAHVQTEIIIHGVVKL